jgi:hypothetical protein
VIADVKREKEEFNYLFYTDEHFLTLSPSPSHIINGNLPAILSSTHTHSLSHLVRFRTVYSGVTRHKQPRSKEGVAVAWSSPSCHLTSPDRPPSCRIPSGAVRTQIGSQASGQLIDLFINLIYI